MGKCIHIYTLNDHLRKPHLLYLHKMEIICNAKNLCNIVVKSLKDTTSMNDEEITWKLICVGTYGASVMKVHRNGLCVKFKISFYFMIPIHYMVHGLNLVYRVIIVHLYVVRVKELIHEIYCYFSCNPKRFEQFKQFSMGESEDEKLLKDVEIRWISMFKLI